MKNIRPQITTDSPSLRASVVTGFPLYSCHSSALRNSRYSCSLFLKSDQMCPERTMPKSIFARSARSRVTASPKVPAAPKRLQIRSHSSFVSLSHHSSLIIHLSFPFSPFTLLSSPFVPRHPRVTRVTQLSHYSSPSYSCFSIGVHRRSSVWLTPPQRGKSRASRDSRSGFCVFRSVMPKMPFKRHKRHVRVIGCHSRRLCRFVSIRVPVSHDMRRGEAWMALAVAPASAVYFWPIRVTPLPLTGFLHDCSEQSANLRLRKTACPVKRLPYVLLHDTVLNKNTTVIDKCCHGNHLETIAGNHRGQENGYEQG